MDPNDRYEPREEYWTEERVDDYIKETKEEKNGKTE